EREDVFENELTEEDLPSGAKREDAAEHERMDPDIDSQAADEFMKDDKEGA
ncbi:MAG: hypothetical protein JOZ59_03135, partial [Candidatus Eremiobacteraeota bacterium]|nr:hypothetical protein [Candidatus Eremiobacteraeota bacterium]